jgi:alcohol dehydrogenase class IV
MVAFPTFAVQTKIVSGIGSLASLADEIAAFSPKKLVVVADRGLAELGVLQSICAHIPGEIAATYLVDPDPGIAAVESTAAAARLIGADLVVGVGGGSALAVGKATAILLTNDTTALELEGKDSVPNRPAPCIAIPTTAGSGSEVSRVLVLHDETRPKDLSLRIEGSQPRVAILDATLLRGAPRGVLLYAGLDAISHSIESLWARRATFFSRAVGYESGQALIEALPLAVEGVASGANPSGENDAVLTTLLDAATAANIACGNSGMGLSHALAATPTVHLPHGQRTGIMLPYVAAFNASEMNDPRALALFAQLEALYERLGFEPKFPAGSAGPAEVDLMLGATIGHPFRANNVRTSTDDDLRDLLAQAGAAV